MKVNMSSFHEWTVSGLRVLSVRQVMEIFESLDSPSLEEMNGEYEATLLGHGGFLRDVAAQFFLSNPLSGWWLGKAFQPLDDHEGCGYNWYTRKGKVVRAFRMRTTIERSRFDGRPSFTLTYSVHRHLYGVVNMVDEVRKMREGLYLGIGTLGFTRKQRLKPRPFVLAGPTGPYCDS